MEPGNAEPHSPAGQPVRAIEGARRHRASPAGPDRGLDRLARSILRLHAEGRVPETWRADGFGREVSMVLSQLGPIRSTAMLAASHARESRLVHGPSRTIAPTPDDADALDVAYALRWLELDAGRR